ncbi:MAG: glycosyltransferase family 4 protein [Ignavibacteriaceae bacterium]
MKILMLADPGSPHTIKWVNNLSKKNVDIFLFGLTEFNSNNYSSIQHLKIHSLNLEGKVFAKKDGSPSKLNYLKAVPAIKKIIKEFVPDILHAHYASSYGLLGSLTGFHPFIISVYGSDVYNFPRKNIITKNLLKFNFAKADKILSTSNVMAEETKAYTNKQIEVTPFGIDLNVFHPAETKANFFDKDDVVIGTVKSLEDKYGIEYLIKAFKIVKDKHPELPLKLLLVGKGSRENQFKKLSIELGISSVTKFTGFINYDQIQDYHNIIDIPVFVSIEESFGVSVLEASACAKPVIVSDAGGLTEVVEKDVTGLIVNKKSVTQTAEAIEKLLLNKDLRLRLGINGREKVKKFYDLKNNISQMISIYEAAGDNFK